MTFTSIPATAGVTPESVVTWFVAPTPLTVWAEAGAAERTTTAKVIATVRSVRRIAAILALLAALWVQPLPAWAHPGTTNFKVPVAKRVTITLVVTADEDSQVTAIDIGIAPGFRLDAVVPTPGWQSA